MEMILYGLKNSWLMNWDGPDLTTRVNFSVAVICGLAVDGALEAELSLDPRIKLSPAGYLSPSSRSLRWNIQHFCRHSVSDQVFFKRDGHTLPTHWNWDRIPAWNNGYSSSRDCQRPGFHFNNDDPHIFPSCCVASSSLWANIFYWMDRFWYWMLHLH